MELVVIWISLALVCAAFVLVFAGRIMSSGSSETSKWRTFSADFNRSFEPLAIRIALLGRKLATYFGGSTEKLELLHARKAELSLERRRERDIAKMAVINDDSHFSNSTLEEFLAATQTDDSAYAEVEVLSEKIENMYDAVQERRAIAKARR